MFLCHVTVVLCHVTMFLCYVTTVLCHVTVVLYHVTVFLCHMTVISSLGSTGTGQFGALGVSWNSGAPPLPTGSPPPLTPAQFSAPGEQAPTQNQRHLERNKTPDDDLGGLVTVRSVSYCTYIQGHCVKWSVVQLSSQYMCMYTCTCTCTCT